MWLELYQARMVHEHMIEHLSGHLQNSILPAQTHPETAQNLRETIASFIHQTSKIET